MSTLSFPQIWIPRPRLAIPSFADLILNTAGKIGRNSNGRAWRRPNGKLGRATGSEPCCCDPPDPCVYCESGTYSSTATVTLAGLAGCGCVAYGPFRSMHVPYGLAGTFDLTVNPYRDDPCYFTAQLAHPSGFVAREYDSSGGCTGTYMPPGFVYFELILGYPMSLTVSALAEGTSSLGYLFKGVISVATSPTPIDCSLAREFSNSLTTCGGGAPGLPNLNTGGTATVTFP